MDIYQIFIFGFIGGCAPEIVRVQRILREGGFFDYKHPYLYVFFSAIMALFGGVLSIAFNSPNILNAIWIGASTPLIITTFAKMSPL